MDYMTNQPCVQPAIYLRMGEIAITDRPAIITTVLGSCVAVTLFDRRRGYGAMCHGVIPSCKFALGCASECSHHGHYVECSVEAMVRRLRTTGTRCSDIEARVFGGAEVFTHPIRYQDLLAVGRQNVESAVRALSNCRIGVRSMTVGGRAGCRISFDTLSGAISVQHLDPARSTDCESACQ